MFTHTPLTGTTPHLLLHLLPCSGIPLDHSQRRGAVIVLRHLPTHKHATAQHPPHTQGRSMHLDTHRAGTHPSTNICAVSWLMGRPEHVFACPPPWPGRPTLQHPVMAAPRSGRRGTHSSHTGCTAGMELRVSVSELYTYNRALSLTSITAPVYLRVAERRAALGLNTSVISWVKDLSTSALPAPSPNFDPMFCFMFSNPDLKAPKTFSACSAPLAPAPAPAAPSWELLLLALALGEAVSLVLGVCGLGSCWEVLASTGFCAHKKEGAHTPTMAA